VGVRVRDLAPLISGRGALLVAVGTFALSQLGDLVLGFSLALRSAERDQPVLTVAIFMAELVPAIVLGSFVGRQLDRRNLRTVVVWSLIVQAACVCAIAACNDLRTQVSLLFLLSAIGLASATGAQLIVARIGDVMGRYRADSRAAFAATVAASVGPAVGGWLYLEYGLRGVCTLDAITFLAMAYAVRHTLRNWSHGPLEADNSSSVRAPKRVTHLATAAVRASRDGLRLFAQSPTLRPAILFVLIVVFATCLEGVAGVYYLRDVVNGDSRAYGLVLACWSVGAAGGSVLSRTKLRLGQPRHALACGGFVLGVGLLCAGVVPNVAAVTIAFLVGGLGNGIFNTALRSVINDVAPQQRGLAWGTFRTLSSAAIALGFCLGAPGVLCPPRVTVVLAGSLAAMAGMILILSMRRSNHESTSALTVSS